MGCEYLLFPGKEVRDSASAIAGGRRRGGDKGATDSGRAERGGAEPAPRDDPGDEGETAAGGEPGGATAGEKAGACGRNA